MALYRRRKMRPGPVQAIRMPVDGSLRETYEFHYMDYSTITEPSYTGTLKVLTIGSGQWLIFEGDKPMAMDDAEFCDVFEEIDQ